MDQFVFVNLKVEHTWSPSIWTTFLRTATHQALVLQPSRVRQCIVVWVHVVRRYKFKNLRPWLTESQVSQPSPVRPHHDGRFDEITDRIRLSRRFVDFESVFNENSVHALFVQDVAPTSRSRNVEAATRPRRGSAECAP